MVGDAGATGVVEAPGRAEDDPVVVPVPVTADRVLSAHGAHIHISPKTTEQPEYPISWGLYHARVLVQFWSCDLGRHYASRMFLVYAEVKQALQKKVPVRGRVRRGKADTPQTTR